MMHFALGLAGVARLVPEEVAPQRLHPRLLLCVVRTTSAPFLTALFLGGWAETDLIDLLHV